MIPSITSPNISTISRCGISSPLIRSGSCTKEYSPFCALLKLSILGVALPKTDAFAQKIEKIMKKSQKYFVEQQNRLAELNGVIEESYSGQSVIKTYNAKEEFKAKYESRAFFWRGKKVIDRNIQNYIKNKNNDI